MKLIIGDRNLSTWSWRAWLALHSYGIPFEDVVIRLDQPNTKKEILKYSPSARVPCLLDGEISIWDSLSIVEYLQEKYPEKNLWPKNRVARAWARSVVCEMHSSFGDLRKLLPGNIQKRLTSFDSSSVQADIDRILQIWTECRQAHKAQGPYLFGEWSLADCFYAPVVFRFQSYAVKMEGPVAEYARAVLAHPSVRELERLALMEHW